MRVARAIPAFLIGLALPAWASNHRPPPVQPATTFAAVEVHDVENVAIAAEPYDTRQKESIFRVDYLSHGVLPVRLIVTNNGDRPISLRDARILFLTAEGDKIQTAQPEDVERLMTRKEREGAKLPMPAPLPAIKLKPRASNKEIEQDFNTFEYHSLEVEPHHAHRLPVLRRIGCRPSAAGGRAAPAPAARCRRERTLLLRAPVRQVPQVKIQTDELICCCRLAAPTRSK
jgi:hypothetical protein